MDKLEAEYTRTTKKLNREIKQMHESAKSAEVAAQHRLQHKAQTVAREYEQRLSALNKELEAQQRDYEGQLAGLQEEVNRWKSQLDMATRKRTAQRRASAAENPPPPETVQVMDRLEQYNQRLTSSVEKRKQEVLAMPQPPPHPPHPFTPLSTHLLCFARFYPPLHPSRSSDPCTRLCTPLSPSIVPLYTPVHPLSRLHALTHPAAHPDTVCTCTPLRPFAPL